MNLERAALGGMLLSRDALADCVEILDGWEFADARHELIFRTCARLFDEGRPVDPLSVADALGADAARVGGSVELLAIASECSTPASAGFYAERILEAAKLRRVGTIGMRLQQIAEGEAGDADELVELARAELDTMTQRETSVDLGALVGEALDEHDRHDGTPTAWRELDELIFRWAPGRLYVVGARPGVGKSVLGVCAALDVARRGQASVVMSAEMSRVEVAQRLLSNVAGVSMTNLMHRRLTDQDWHRIAAARSNLDGLPLVIDDRAGMRVSDVASVARSVVRRRPVGLVVVDYVQLLAPPAHLVKRSREEQVAHTARSLKNLAKQLQIPIVALAQLNRGSQQRADKRPGMADLRESGELEQAADVVLLLHRPPDDSDDPESPPDELAVVVPKNRQGVTGAFPLHWQGDYARASSQGMR